LKAHVLGVLFSARKKGWTSSLLDAALEAAGAVKDVTVEKIHARDYKYIPCQACSSCIRDPQHHCILDDDFGRKGEGVLYKKVRDTNGIILSEPVYLWGSCALCRMFIERMYQFIWNGEINGQPFASIECAGNSGWQYWATADVPRQMFNYGSRYLGGVMVHACYLEEGLANARSMGKKLAEAALADAAGRKKVTDREKFRMYSGPWDVTEGYLMQLTNGSMKPEDSMSSKSLRTGAFKRPDALEILKKADAKIQNAFKAWEKGDIEKARDELSDGSALWTEATWREFLEEKVIRGKKPEAYRPVSDL
jgi:multimeric flavodoxin WrbA